MEPVDREVQIGLSEGRVAPVWVLPSGQERATKQGVSLVVVVDPPPQVVDLPIERCQIHPPNRCLLPPSVGA